MRRLTLSTAAQRDLDNIQRYLDEWTNDDRVADRVIGRIARQCERLAELPGILGRPRPDLATNLRSFPYESYVIFFRYPDDETLEIVNVLSAKRDIDDFPFGEPDEP
jgi:toxin ParE1/3/4